MGHTGSTKGRSAVSVMSIVSLGFHHGLTLR